MQEVEDSDTETFPCNCSRGFGMQGRVMDGEVNRLSSDGNQDLFGHRGANRTILQ